MRSFAGFPLGIDLDLDLEGLEGGEVDLGELAFGFVGVKNENRPRAHFVFVGVDFFPFLIMG